MFEYLAACSCEYSLHVAVNIENPENKVIYLGQVSYGQDEILLSFEVF